MRHTEPARRRVGWVNVATSAETEMVEPRTIDGAIVENTAETALGSTSVLPEAAAAAVEKVAERAEGEMVLSSTKDGASVENEAVRALGETDIPSSIAAAGCENTADTTPADTR